MDFHNNLKKKVFLSNKTFLLLILFFFIVFFIGVEMDYMRFQKQKEKVEFKEDEEIPKEVDSNLNFSYDKSGAFLFQVKGSLIRQEQAFLIGKVLRGTIHVGDMVTLYGNTISQKRIFEIHRNGENLNEASIGSSVQLVLEDVRKEEISYLQVLAMANSMKKEKQFEALVTLDETLDLFYFDLKYKKILGTLEVLKDVNEMEKLVLITLEEEVYLGDGLDFDILNYEHLIGNGSIVKVYSK